MVEAVAVKGEKIIFAGTNTGAEEFKNEKTEIIDLHGKTMTPGFIEGHGHFLGMGFNELTLNLSDIKSYEELVEKVERSDNESKTRAMDHWQRAGTRKNGTHGHLK